MNIETANRLYELRKQQGLSQEELAEKLGVSRQAVSKWERSEASPDTDNLISLAKLYNLTLDELIYGEKKESGEETATQSDKDTAKANNNKEKAEKAKTEINLGPGGIFIEDEDGDTVKINLSGIKIQSNNPIFDNEDEEDDDDDNDNEYVEYSDEDVVIIGANGEVKVKKEKKSNFWRDVPYPIICALAYLVFGFCDILGGWALSWIIFITIPIYYSIVEAICKKRFNEFAYPVLTVFLYLYTGLYHGNWHPSWLIFITVPIYSCIASSLDKVIKNRSKKS